LTTKAPYKPAPAQAGGYESYVVQELEIRPRVIRYRRARWLTPAGRTVVAPLPAGISGHFGPHLRRFVLAQCHQGQVRVPRLVAPLRDFGLAVSKRQVVRLLTAGKKPFLDQARPLDKLRSAARRAQKRGLAYGRRHRGTSQSLPRRRPGAQNAFCTPIGNNRCAWFGTTAAKTKSRRNVLDPGLRRGRLCCAPAMTTT
jgi:hypothetical protein